MTTTDGRRIYAIGDIHGCRDALRDMLDRIRADIKACPHDKPVIVFLGDYVDRGPDSRGVIDDLVDLSQGQVPTVFLLGNHDDYFLTYLTDPAAPATMRYHWLHSRLGGDRTLASYGVTGLDSHDPLATFDATVAAVPPAHVQFLQQARLYWTAGSYAFIHAGMRPGKPLEDQDREDLIFIRDPFLRHPRPFGHIVVHGHTPVNDIEHHGNRIGIDTGAVFGGRLSCVVLQDDTVFDLRKSGRVQLRADARIT